MLICRGLYRVISALCLAITAYVGFARMVTAQDGPTYNIVFLIDSSGSIVDGTGTNDGKATDPDDKRIRFARFLVRYMQAFHPEKSRVGVIRFYGKVTKDDELIPLTWVHAWSLADLKKIGDADNKGLAFTNFEVGLATAGRYFIDEAGSPLPCSDDPSGEQCYILLFSDGEFEGQNQNQPEVAKLLKDLRQKSQIQVVPVLFGKNQDAAWWQENAGVVINDKEDRQAVYAEIFQQLKLDAPSERFVESVLFDDQITLPLIRTTHFHQEVSITLIADDLIFDTWDPAPTPNAGLGRWWLDPAEGEILGTLQQSRGAQSGQTLVYYTLGESFYPLNVTAMIVPEYAHVNQPVQLSAQLSVRGRPFTETAGFGINAGIEPDGALISLLPQADGRFTGGITRTIPGTYTVTFVPTVPVTWEHLTVNEVQQSFYVDDKLYLTSMETSVIPDKVAVGNAVEIRGRFLYDGQPILQAKGFGIDAEIQPGNITRSLVQGKDGWWVNTITPTLAGPYTVTLTPIIPFVGVQIAAAIPDNYFYVGQVPEIQLKVENPIKTANGFDIPISLVVDNYATIAGFYTPSLQYEISGLVLPITLQSIHSGTFTGMIPVSQAVELSLSAWLSPGITTQGVVFPRTSAYYLTTLPSTDNPVMTWWQRLAVLWPMILILPLLILMIWWMRRPRYRLIHALQKAFSNHAEKETLKTVFAQNNTFTEEWWDLLDKTSRLIIKNTFQD